FASDDKLRAELNEVNAQMLDLQQQLDELQRKAAEVPDVLPVGDWVPPEVLDQFHKLEASLQRQLALYGQTSEVAKLRYEMEHGSLQGLNAEQQTRLEQLAAELDAKAALTEREKELDALRKEIEQGRLERLDPLEREQERYAQQLEMLRAFHEEKLITQEELWALELEAFLNHEAALTEAAKQGADQRKKVEEQYSKAVSTLRMGVFTEFTALLRAMPGESKAVALSLLAVEKGLRIAETFISTQAAAQRALAELPYPANLAMAAKVEAIGKVRMGLIAATGLVEAAT